MWRPSRFDTMPTPGNYVRSAAAALALAGVGSLLKTRTVADAKVDPAAVTAQRLLPVLKYGVGTSTPQPESQTFPRADKIPGWDGKEGIELTTSRAVYIGLVPADTQLVKVALPSSLEAQQTKITFVGVRWAGQKVISRCAFVSNWEVRQKYHKDFLPAEPDNPCGIDQLNQLKKMSGAGVTFNGKNKVDGGRSQVLNTPSCDPTFYRNYAPAIDTEVGTPENSRLFFQNRVYLDNGTVVQQYDSIFYRYRKPKKAANFFRLDPVNILGATVQEVETMSLWGTGDSDCAKPSFTGPDKPDNAVRGHNPISGAKS